MTNSTQSRTRAKAIDAFIAKKIKIDRLLERLAALSDDHFNVSPEDVNWSHVGTLEHYAACLREISDSAFGEGEYAK